MLRDNALQDFIATGDSRLVALSIASVLAVIAVLLGISLAWLGPLLTAIALVGLAVGVAIMWDLEYAMWTVIGVITLLPFATLPVKIVFTPTFLDVVLGIAVGLYVLQWMTGERRRLTTTPVHTLIILFMTLSVFSFVAGMRFTGMNITTARRFAELLLSMGFALILVDYIENVAQLKRFVLIIILGGAMAALLAVGFWFLPDLTADRLLSRLAIIGYPGGGVIQYIESNPNLPERAIGTSVNPNALGGLLVLVGALTVPQLVADEPLTGKRWHAIPVAGVMVLALILTFSRGSMLAFACAMLFIAALRYRKLLGVMVIIGLVILILPWSQTYITRFLEGFQGADLATQMRFGEYRDAITLITRYPLLGVGFIGAPDIDIYLGVASVYLTMASNMGLLGVVTFLALMGGLFLYAWQARPHLGLIEGMPAIWLGLFASLVGVLINGIFDHYFFNLEFMAAITFFWVFVGLLMAATRLTLQERERQQTIEKTIASQ